MALQHEMNIGINSDDRRVVAEGLARITASTYMLYLKTHGFHWNVTGMLSNNLHLMFEKQYTELWMSVDTLAERIRALGHFAPHSARELSKLTLIQDAEVIPPAKEMIRQLTEGHELISRESRKLYEATERCKDEATSNLLTERIQYHEKSAWMLRALIEE